MKIEKDKITVNYIVMICFDIFRFDSVHKLYNLHTWGPFNNYVDKMRGEGVKKCLFLSSLRVQKLSTQGGG